MFYKLSNTATRKQIQDEFKVTFEFPKLYKPTAVINGLVESSMAIITMDSPRHVSYGIWGLLPQPLEDNWKVFQHLTNTLNTNIETLNDNDPLYSEALDKRRCIIITTGFFTSALNNGKMYPFHVHLPDYKPFCIAGVYNQLNDGFVTFSILVKKADDTLKEIPHFLEYKPLIFSPNDRNHWLNQELSYDALSDLVKSHQPYHFEAHPVSKEFYDNDLMYKKIIKDDSFKHLLMES